jgi:hypothetical protein
MVTLRHLLRENGITPGKWADGPTREAAIRSHVVRAELVEPVRLDTLYRRDRLWLVWRLYFQSVLRYLAVRPRNAES